MKTRTGNWLLWSSLLLAGGCGPGVGASGGVEGAASSAPESLPAIEQSASGAVGGGLRELSVIETEHPYDDNFTRRWEVYGARDARQIVIRFERFELEEDYDFITITDAAGGQRSQHTGTKTGAEVVITGNRATITISTDDGVTDWGFKLVVSERLPCICTEQYDPVCGVDGVTYSNDCFAGCAGVDVASGGTCESAEEEKSRFESQHRPIVIPDNSRWGISSALEVKAGGRTRRVRVSVDIRHPYRGDLRVSIFSPNGDETVLHNRSGGSAEDLTIREVPVGVARAETIGTWRLWVRDEAAQDVGTLAKWWIDLE